MHRTWCKATRHELFRITQREVVSWSSTLALATGYGRRLMYLCGRCTCQGSTSTLNQLGEVLGRP